jgi:hypothetical protein
MKNWKLKLKNLEENNDWIKAINLFETVSDDNLSTEESIDINVRIMFIITYCLLENEFSEKEYLYGETVLQKIFKKSYQKFSTNSDYLFCLSVITKLNEFVFNLNIKDPELFIEKAIDLDPNFRLYQYWLDLRFKNKKRKVQKEYLQSSFIIDWKNKKGLLGRYVIDYLERKTLDN